MTSLQFSASLGNFFNVNLTVQNLTFCQVESYSSNETLCSCTTSPQVSPLNRLKYRIYVKAVYAVSPLSVNMTFSPRWQAIETNYSFSFTFSGLIFAMTSLLFVSYREEKNKQSKLIDYFILFII